MACCTGKHIHPALLTFIAIIIHFPVLYSQQEDGIIEEIPFQPLQNIVGCEESCIKPQQENYRIEKIPLKGELVNFSGQCFLQDSEGFIWFGSNEGLYRYSGSGFKIFRNDPYNPGSLSNNYITTLFEDRNGVIWIGTENGLNRFDKQTESFYFFQHRDDDSTSIGSGGIRVIMEDDKGVLWIATNYGFCRYHPGIETFQNYCIKRQDDSSHLHDYQIYGIHPDRKGNLWLNTDDGLYRFNIGTGSFQKFNSNFSWSIYEDRSERCWLIGRPGLILFNTQDYSIKTYLNDPGDPNHLHGKEARAIDRRPIGEHLDTFMGWPPLLHSNLELKSYIRHEHEYPVTYDNLDLTRDLLVDNTGSVWYYTPEGINKIIARNKDFKVYDYHDRIAFWVNSIYVENKDLLWYGTLNGLCSFDRKNDLFQRHYGSDWESGFQHYLNYYVYGPGGNTLDLYVEYRTLLHEAIQGSTDHEDRILPGSFEALTIAGEDFYRIDHIFEDSRGRLWTGFTDEGPLRYLDRKNERVVRIVDNPSSMNSLPGKVQVRHETASGILLAAGESGACKIIPPFTRVSDSEVMPADVIRINDIPGVRTSYLDSTGILWFGTEKHGLIKLAGNDLRTYTTDQGLAGNQVMSIIPDDKGNLWIGTENGLSKFDLQTRTFVNYYVRHGLPVNQFRPKSVARGEDGELFFGTERGMISFYPDSIQLNRNVAPVKLTDFKIQNQSVIPGEHSVLKKSIGNTERIDLKYNQGHLSFEFAILSYHHPELNQYRYILEGSDRDWIYSGTRNFAIYSNLSPGKYTFRVTGANNDGFWNEEGTSVDMIIHPPPWLTWYAYLLYLVLAVGIFLWIRSYLLNKARMRSELEVERIEKEKVLEMDAIKSRFFANISHEFRTPLTLILGPVEEFLKSTKKGVGLRKDMVRMIHRNAKRLQGLINQLLDLSKMETGELKLYVSKGDLKEFSRTIILSFLSLAESRKIRYSFDLPGESHEVWFDSDKVEKILVNLLSNAFKFTPEKGEVRIHFEYLVPGESEMPEWVEIAVSDTGRGISPEHLDRIFDRFFQVVFRSCDSDHMDEVGTGIGLALTKELVELCRGEIGVDSLSGGR